MTTMVTLSPHLAQGQVIPGGDDAGLDDGTRNGLKRAGHVAAPGAGC